ncbi:hypothetical protein C0991_000907 [Blastosporella zonata]|nr:hypothetical protein C0991_000907 [Blastosporella zonata]
MSSPSAPAPSSGTCVHSQLSDYQLLKVIGEGRTGRVFLALDRASNAPVAVKVIPKGNGKDDIALNEQAIHSSIKNCGFSVPLLASFHDELNFYLVTAYLGGYDMDFNLGLAECFVEERVKFYAAELVVALEELKACNVVHRDIKPSNLAFTYDGHIRILDFGYAKRLTRAQEVNFDADPNASEGSFRFPDPDYTTTERVGSASYMSAAVHLGLPYSFEADTHAMGVILFQMATGRLPFGHNAWYDEEVMEDIVCHRLSFRPEDDVSPELRDLISILLPRYWMTPVQLDVIKAHPFFNGVRWDKVKAQTTIPPWRPLVAPLPKEVKKCTMVVEGAQCLPDPYPNFSYVSSQFQAQRRQATGSISRGFARLFNGHTNTAPLRPVAAAAAVTIPTRPTPPPPILPVILLTHPEDEGEKEKKDLEVTPATQAPLADITNQQMLLPEPPDRNSLVPSRPVSTLALPKQRKRQKENEGYLVAPKATPKPKTAGGPLELVTARNPKVKLRSTVLPKPSPVPTRATKAKPRPVPYGSRKPSTPAPASEAPTTKLPFRVPGRVLSSTNSPKLLSNSEPLRAPAPVSPSPTAAQIVDCADRTGGLDTVVQVEQYVGQAEALDKQANLPQLLEESGGCSLVRWAPLMATENSQAHLSMLATAPPIKVDGGHLPRSPEGFNNNLRRFWTRVFMFLDRVLPWIRTCF